MMSDGFEAQMIKLSSMKDIRTHAERETEFQVALMESLRPCIETIQVLFKRLKLKDK
jgi:hypothetical protein